MLTCCETEIYQHTRDWLETLCIIHFSAKCTCVSLCLHLRVGNNECKIDVNGCLRLMRNDIYERKLFKYHTDGLMKYEVFGVPDSCLKLLLLLMSQIPKIITSP